MRFSVALGVLLLALGWVPQPGHAQLTTDECKGRRVVVNSANGGTDFTIGASVVQVVSENNTRCNLTIRNKGAAPMRCMPVVQGTPSTTVGLEFLADKQLTLDTSSRPAWLCIRSTGTSTIAETIEELP